MSGGGSRKIGKGGPIKSSVRRRRKAGTGRRIRAKLHRRSRTSQTKRLTQLRLNREMKKPLVVESEQKPSFNPFAHL